MSASPENQKLILATTLIVTQTLLRSIGKHLVAHIGPEAAGVEPTREKKIEAILTARDILAAVAQQLGNAGAEGLGAGAKSDDTELQRYVHEREMWDQAKRDGLVAYILGRIDVDPED